ncbi:oxidoreductase-like domain-containing protein [Stutzerimonas tarimensis]|uniref:Oxidoreductase-like domain-containing protein n=1 Tax=Stutzerimonas tarimensis TaxID=1507735 RepID=A0ABV7T6I2_9GAMM
MKTLCDDPRAEPPSPPSPPADGECCESECGDACIWTDYYEARARYEQALAEWRARQREQ